MEVKIELPNNDILKELRSFFMYIHRAFQSGKAQFTGLNKPQLLLDLIDRMVSFERVLWLVIYTSDNHIFSVVIYQIIREKSSVAFVLWLMTSSSLNYYYVTSSQEVFGPIFFF